MIKYDKSILLTSAITEADEESWCACNSGRIRPLMIELSDLEEIMEQYS